LNLARYTNGGPATLYRPVGCRACDGLGYSGRIGIFELMAMDAELRGLVMRRADSSMLLKAAVAGGMTTMFEDGLKKVLAGVTTIEEVRRVTREY
jgi:general secretion pathway protein E